MDYTNIKVYFDISGNAFPVDEITKILEISPTLTYLKGDSIRGKKIKRKETSWELGSEYQISYDVNNQLVPIINQLLSKEKELIRIREKYSVSFIVFIIIKIENNESPAITLSSEIMGFLSRIGAEISIDLYSMS